MNTKEILLIMPAYNEENNIAGTLHKLKSANMMDKLDIVVINDGSIDGTEAVAKAAKINVISQVYNLGYGAALQTGYKYAVDKGYKYILQMDTDGQHDIRNLDRIIEKLIPENPENVRIPDMVIGSRFIDGSESFYISKLKVVAIKLFRYVIRKLTGYRLTDPTSGLMGMNLKTFSYYAKYTRFDTKYPDLNMLVQMLLLGYHIEEIPAIMHARTEGESMHDGIWNAGRYMFIMALSTFNTYLRYRKGRRG